MTPSTPENFWLVDWSLVTIMGNAMPPRDPNDDDDEDEEDEEDENDEPAVVREPNEGRLDRPFCGGFLREPGPNFPSVSTARLPRIAASPAGCEAKGCVMATRHQRISDFDSEGEPPAGHLMELLCEDNNGTYVLPFSLSLG